MNDLFDAFQSNATENKSFNFSSPNPGNFVTLIPTPVTCTKCNSKKSNLKSLRLVAISKYHVSPILAADFVLDLIGNSL